MTYTPPRNPYRPQAIEDTDTVHFAACAIADAIRKNQNPYRTETIDISQMASTVVSYFGGPPGPKQPEVIDPFSALYGAALCLACVMFNGGDTWAEPNTKQK